MKHDIQFYWYWLVTSIENVLHDIFSKETGKEKWTV